MVDVDGVFSHFQATPLKLKRRAPSAPTVARRSPPQNPAPARRHRVPSKMVARQSSRTKLTGGVVAPPTKRVLPMHPSSVKKRKLVLAMPPPDDDDTGPVQQKLVFDTPPRKAARTHKHAPATDNDKDDMLNIDSGLTPPRPMTPPLAETPPRSETPLRSETPPQPATPQRSEVVRIAAAAATEAAAYETPKKRAPPSRSHVLSPLSYLRLHSAPTEDNEGPPPFSPNVFDEPRRLEPSVDASVLPPTPPLPPSEAPVADPGSPSPRKPAKRELLAPLQPRRSARLQAVSGDFEALALDRPAHLRRTPGKKALRTRAHTAIVQGYMDAALAKAPPTTSSTVVALSWASIQELYTTKVLPKTISTALHAVFTLWMLCEDVVANPEPSSTRLAFAAFDQSAMDLRYEASDGHGALRNVPVLVAHYAALYDQLTALTPTQQALLHTVLGHVASVASAYPLSSALTLLQTAWTTGAPRLVPAAITYFATITTHPETLLHKAGLLAGSLLRHVLRAIFLSFDARLDAGDSRAPSVALPKALYAHHDLGAAVHRALVDRAAAALDDYHAALCTDFLATAFQTLYRYRSEPYLQAHIGIMETTAARIAALGLDDEAHLAPLASLSTFAATLEKEQRAVAGFLARVPMPAPRDLPCPMPGKESTPLKTRLDAASGCFECKQALNSDAIVECRTCHHKYHLACLYLPSTFRDPSRRYVCPHCL